MNSRFAYNGLYRGHKAKEEAHNGVRYVINLSLHRATGHGMPNLAEPERRSSDMNSPYRYYAKTRDRFINGV